MYEEDRVEGIEEVDFLLELEIGIGLALLFLNDFIKSVLFGREEERNDDGVVEDDDEFEEGGVIKEGFFKKFDGAYKNGLNPGIFGKIECNLCWFEEAAARRGLIPLKFGGLDLEAELNEALRIGLELLEFAKAMGLGFL